MSTRYYCTQVEAAEGTNPMSAEDACELPGLGVLDQDFQIPWNEQEHQAIYGVVNTIPQQHVSKELKCGFDANYVFLHGGPLVRFFGAPTYADGLNTFKIPDAYAAAQSYAWNFRHGSKAVDVIGAFTTGLEFKMQQFDVIRLTESVMAHRAVDGTLLTNVPTFPAVTNEEAWFWNQVATKTMGGDDLGTLKMARVRMLEGMTREYGGANDYCQRIVKSYNTFVDFDLTATFNGSTDELRDKLVADSQEPLILKISKSASIYFQIKLFNTQYTKIEMNALKSGSLIYTVYGYCMLDGSDDYIEIELKDGVDYS